MPSLPIHSALGIALLLISPLASALGFGPSRNQTTLGQHLDFRASVLLDADEAMPRDCVRADVFAGDFPVPARHVRAVLQATRDPAQRIVRVTTAIAIDEPVVSLDISVGCGARLSRRFVAFIDPPALRLAETATSETVPLPSARIDSQVAALADVASRRRGGVRAVRDDVERAPRAPRRPAHAPSATSVASVAPAPPVRSRRQDAATRRTEQKTRTALAAPPRSHSARLQLDPPRILVAQRPAAAAPASPVPLPNALLATPVAVGLAGPAATAAAASAPTVVARAATDPLLAQVAAAAAAASGASLPTDPEADKVRALEAEMARMRSESEATRQTVAALQARVRQAEEGRYRNGLVYALAATTLLAALVAALLGWLRPRQRSRARWFDAQAQQQARATRRAGPSTAAGLASQPAPLSRPAPLPHPAPSTPTFAQAAARPAPASPSSTSGWNTSAGGLLPTTQHSSIGGLEVTTVLGPELSRPVESFPGGAAARRHGGEMTMEELIDLEQQAEFFVILGQDEAALTLLENYVDANGKSPLPYLQLLEIHQRRDDRDAYDNIRHAFNERFNANAPDWSVRMQGGRSLEDYPQTIATLQSLWSTPLSAMHALDDLLFRRDAVDETFDFPAYRELLFLYSVAREISEHVETGFGSIDLFLPLEDAPADPIRAMERTAPIVVDLDVSQWPEDAAMSDLLGRPEPSGRRGAA